MVRRFVGFGSVRKSFARKIRRIFCAKCLAGGDTGSIIETEYENKRRDAPKGRAMKKEENFTMDF